MPTTRSKAKVVHDIKPNSSEGAGTPEKEKEKKTFKRVAIRPPEDSYRLASFDGVPVAVIKIIQQYLSYYDYRQLMNTNASIFQHTKFETVYYNFMGFEKWKRKIHGFEDAQEKKDFFVSFANMGVKDKSKQVSLRIYHPTQKIMKENGHLMPGIHKLHFIDNYTGNFWRMKDVDMSVFCNIYHVIIDQFKCRERKRLSGLSNIVILEVSNSDDLQTIDFIPTLRRLSVSRCIAMRELRDYSNIPELFVLESWYFQISQMANHEKLWLHHGGKIDNLSYIASVPYVSLMSNHIDGSAVLTAMASSKASLEYCDIYGANGSNTEMSVVTHHRFLKFHSVLLSMVDVFPRLEAIDLEHCTIKSLAPLQNVKKLRLSTCKGTMDLKFLVRLEKLFLEDINDISDVSMLGGLKELYISGCRNITDVSALGTVKKLTIYSLFVTNITTLGRANSEVTLNLKNVDDFSSLRNLWKVELHYCENLQTTSALIGVRHVKFNRCVNLEDVSDLSQAQSVVLVQCDKVRSLKGLKNVPRIELEWCNGIEDILEDLGNQQRLEIKYCRLLNEKMKTPKLREIYEEFLEQIPYVRINAPVSGNHYSRRDILPAVFH